MSAFSRSNTVRAWLFTAGNVGMVALFGSAIVAGGWDDATDAVQIPAFIVMLVGIGGYYLLGWRERRQR